MKKPGGCRAPQCTVRLPRKGMGKVFQLGKQGKYKAEKEKEQVERMPIRKRNNEKAHKRINREAFVKKKSLPKVRFTLY